MGRSGAWMTAGAALAWSGSIWAADWEAVQRRATHTALAGAVPGAAVAAGAVVASTVHLAPGLGGQRGEEAARIGGLGSAAMWPVGVGGSVLLAGGSLRAARAVRELGGEAESAAGWTSLGLTGAALVPFSLSNLPNLGERQQLGLLIASGYTMGAAQLAGYVQLGVNRVGFYDLQRVPVGSVVSEAEATLRLGAAIQSAGWVVGAPTLIWYRRRAERRPEGDHRLAALPILTAGPLAVVTGQVMMLSGALQAQGAVNAGGDLVGPGLGYAAIGLSAAGGGALAVGLADRRPATAGLGAVTWLGGALAATAQLRSARGAHQGSSAFSTELSAAWMPPLTLQLAF